MQEVTGHRLSVHVVEARGLKPTNYFGGESDTYAEFHVRDLVKKSTEVAFGTRAPKWDETHVLELGSEPMQEVLSVAIYGRHLIGKNTFVGRVQVPLSLVLPDVDAPPLDADDDESGSSNGVRAQLQEVESVTRWYKLQPQEGRTKYEETPGYVRLALQYIYAPEVKPQPEPEPAAAAPVAPAGPVPPPNTTLYYQCPMCSQLFLPDVISAHMQQCSSSAASHAGATASSSLPSAHGQQPPQPQPQRPPSPPVAQQAPNPYAQPPQQSAHTSMYPPTAGSPPSAAPPPADKAYLYAPKAQDSAYLSQAPAGAGSPPAQQQQDEQRYDTPMYGQAEQQQPQQQQQQYGYGAPSYGAEGGQGADPSHASMVEYYKRISEMEKSGSSAAPAYPSYDAQYQ